MGGGIDTISILGKGDWAMYENDVTCITCQNCKTVEVADEEGHIISEKFYCVIDGCEVDGDMVCGGYQ